MKIKRLISLLLILVLLGGSMPVLAANAGSRQDPLLSRSYVQTWSSDLLARVEETARTAVQAALDKALQTYDASLSTDAGKSRICTLFAGNTVELKTGDCFTVLSGDAAVSVASGALVDATDGRQVATGALQTAHRYIACENVQATITCTQAGTLLLSAGTYVTRYVDVPATAWYAPYVEYATVNKLMSGIGNRCFSPDTVLTRGMFVTMLARLAGVNQADYPDSRFADVEASAWYAPSVSWAASKGIVSGVGDGKFEPNRNITRQEMAVIMAGYLAWKGIDTTPGTEASAYNIADLDDIAPWALKSVCFCYEKKLLTGRGTSFAPLANATRAEACVVLCGLHDFLTASGG